MWPPPGLLSPMSHIFRSLIALIGIVPVCLLADDRLVTVSPSQGSLLGALYGFRMADRLHGWVVVKDDYWTTADAGYSWQQVPKAKAKPLVPGSRAASYSPRAVGGSRLPEERGIGQTGSCKTLPQSCCD